MHEKLVDTLFFKHQYITAPNIIMTDAAVLAAKQLVMVIQGEVPTNIGGTEKEQLT